VDRSAARDPWLAAGDIAAFNRRFEVAPTQARTHSCRLDDIFSVPADRVVCNSNAPAGAVLDLILSQWWRNGGEAFAIHAAS
jgi:hypothetical protein